VFRVLDLEGDFMKVVFHEFFHHTYTSDPAAAHGRLEGIVEAIPKDVPFVTAEPATDQQLAAVHTPGQIEDVKREGLYEIAALAAGGAIQTARIGLVEPAFGIIRPPGHHASADSCWGFCYFNNMAVALKALRDAQLIASALVLDIDLHYGDGTVNILGDEDWVTVYNPASQRRQGYLAEVADLLSDVNVDLIGVSAGFDYHVDDWGGLLTTADYQAIGALVRQAANASRAGYFALLEGGYNHSVLGPNVAALLHGFKGRSPNTV
jgi:acetoin utilization deacetylase AcuC-like enzyme